MRHCIAHEEGSIKIKKENMPKVIQALRDYLDKGNRLTWVDGNWDIDDDLEEIWYDLRYDIEDNKEYYEIVDFSGEKLGDDKKLFSLIAPYCEDGYLQFNGENGDHFRIIIKDGKAEEKWAKLSWD